ncbi:MAG: hypothetical protein V3S13_02045, partial [Candidatus Omnitrophota bacterium]
LLIAVISIIPAKIIGYGYMPGDDANRHAAKVVSGKDWSEILVLRDDVTMDSHPGWHAILNVFYKATNCSTDELVNISVILLFILFSLVPLVLLERPEAWPISLLIFAVASPSLIIRLLHGRPFIFTMAVVLVLCFLWQKLRSKKLPYKLLVILTLLMAASTWIHCAWYLLGLPVICFFIAREWRAAILVSFSTIIGIVLGASFTGHPYLLIKQNILHVIHAFGSHDFQHMLVGEFQSSRGDVLMVIVVAGMLAWRKIRGAWDPKVIDNPVFILAVSGWALGFVANRFWFDWGMVATIAWISLELQETLKDKMNHFSWRRVLITISILGILYIAVTNDSDRRWTRNLSIKYLHLDNPDHAPWLPGPEGIVYSNSMRIFYQTFLKNPHAPWRYMLGFEPVIMPPEDLKIYRDMQRNFFHPSKYEPWVKKMSPEDRLIINHTPEKAPKIKGLDWHLVTGSVWSGRLPRDTEEKEVEKQDKEEMTEGEGKAKEGVKK